MEGEPDPHGEEDCTELIAGPNRWNDFDCDDKRRSICFKCLPEYSGIVCEEGNSFFINALNIQMGFTCF